MHIYDTISIFELQWVVTWLLVSILEIVLSRQVNQSFIVSYTPKKYRALS